MNQTQSILMLLILNCFLSSAQIFDVDTIQYTGDINNRINLIILGDGYQSSELPQFMIDAENFTNSLFSVQPYTEYQSFFNAFAIKVPSNESGASHPGTATDVPEPAHPVIQVDNYFGSTFDAYGIHRLLVAENTVAITNVLANNFPSYDQVFILVNSPYYGGSGGQFPTASLDSASSEIAVHELGHSFVGLLDEYYAGDIYAREGINMTQETDPSLVRWKNWYGDYGIGIYQHCCDGNSADWYKPHQNCKMQFLGSPFCSVCIEGTIETIHSLANPIVSYIPSDTNISTPTFPIELELELIEPVPNTFKRQWVLNDSIVDMNVDSIQIAENDLDLGTNTLTVFIEDTTELLRVDDHENIHIYSVSWMIENTPAQNVEIPDTAFLYALIDGGVDTSGDSLISFVEAEAIISLNVSGRGITDMTGIEAFINLDTLDCSSNSLTSLDLSNNTALIDLDLGTNELTSLDVSNNTLLEWLTSTNNELTSLDISNNPVLKGLYIQDNQIDSLNVTSNTALLYLRCRGNQLASLDVTNNISLKSLSIDEMPTLSEVCVWELPFPPEGVEIDTAGSPNVCFETDCDGTCGTTGINTNSPTGLSIYPNPTDNILTIEIVEPGHHSIEITSLNGQLLYSDKNEGPTHQIDLSSYQKGVYFITVRTRDYVKTEKIIKQ